MMTSKKEQEQMVNERKTAGDDVFKNCLPGMMECLKTFEKEGISGLVEDVSFIGRVNSLSLWDIDMPGHSFLLLWNKDFGPIYFFEEDEEYQSVVALFSQHGKNMGIEEYIKDGFEKEEIEWNNKK